MTDERSHAQLTALAAAGLPAPARASCADSLKALPRPLRHPVPPANFGLALIATRNFIPFAKLTAQNFLMHHPEFQAFLLLVDGKPEDAEIFPEGHVVLLDDLNLHDAGWYAAKFTAAEFSNALKPCLLQYLSAGVDKVIYLDCDIVVFSHLTEMLDELATHDLVLIPHMMTPPDRPEQFWTRPSRADTFNAGLINAGCFGIRPARCADFLSTWEQMNLAPGAFYEPAGYQTDQQHLNWALVAMAGVTVLRDNRYNVAYWNLHERNLRSDVSSSGSALDARPRFHVDDRPLGFFHFSGYDIFDRQRISRHDGRHSVYNLPAIAEILNWYSDEILSCPSAGLMHESYGFDRLANGLPLNGFVRGILKKHEAWIPRFDGRSVAGADALCGFLMDPLPATGSLLPLVTAEIYERRPDLRNAFPGAHTAAAPLGFWRWFCRHASFEYEIGFLIDRFRRTLVSGNLIEFADRVRAVIGEDIRFLGVDRQVAADRLHDADEPEYAIQLLETQMEWFFFTDLSAALEIYTQRVGLQRSFPDILDRDHSAFCDWLSRHAPVEHGSPARLGDRFRRCTAAQSLGRIFSYLSRREDVAESFQDLLLSDDPEQLLRALIRDAASGLEYDLDDVLVLRFAHSTSRHLLVPLYLELPLIRMRSHTSRSPAAAFASLPEGVRHTDWAVRGCKLHASHFDRFESYLDEEMRRWSDTMGPKSRSVIGLLRTPKSGDPAMKLVGHAYRAAMKRADIGLTSASPGLAQRLTQRAQRPGVNIFGYFYSDIGVGESTRGLAQAVSLFRPVNPIPLCTSQLQSATVLSQLFQRFDYLSDTNVFVSYPHQVEDLLSMIRPEQLSGRRNIAHLAWEQKDGNPLWKEVYDRYDEIWTISEFASTSFRKMFPGRVRVVPNVVPFERFPGFKEAGTVRLTRDVLEYLFVFDANSSIERKNPEAVISAFIRAFKDTVHAKRVKLTLKINSMRRTEHAVRIRALLQQAAESGLAIAFDDRHLERAAMLRMIAEADCYVSLHRAEGFGYTMAEAMFYGVPVIASGYSGNLEYMTDDNSYLVPCKETFVAKPDGPFQRGSVWGEPDIDFAAALMRRVAEKPAEAKAIGERGTKTVIDKLGAAAIAEKIKSCFVPASSSRQNNLRQAAE